MSNVGVFAPAIDTRHLHLPLGRNRLLSGFLKAIIAQKRVILLVLKGSQPGRTGVSYNERKRSGRTLQVRLRRSDGRSYGVN